MGECKPSQIFSSNFLNVINYIYNVLLVGFFMKHIPKLSDKQYAELLKLYNLGDLISRENKSRSFDTGVYLFRTNKGKYVLKIFIQSNLSNVRYQNKIIDYLSNVGIPVPENILNNNGKEITRFGGRNVLIQKFIEGRERKPLSFKLVKEMAKNFAKMHKAMLKFKINRDEKLNVSRYKALKLPDEARFDYAREFQKEALNNFHKIPLRRLRKCHIHGDISSVNFLTGGDKLKAIIDWEEAHYGILVYDLAVFITQNFVKNGLILRKKIKLFMEEYQKVMKISDYEMNAIYYLIKYRLVIVIHWYTFRMGSYGMGAGWMKRGLLRAFSCMKRFDKLTFEDFLEMIDN